MLVLTSPRARIAAVVTVIVLAGVVLFTLLQLSPSLLVANTTPAGGDMGAHVWGPAYLRDHLLPQGRITGWTPDWYGGFPALVFYFPLPSLLIVLLDVVLPYGIAFKLVTVSGIVSLPVAAWGMGKLMGMRAPAPLMLGIATLPFLFERSFTIYGGNIPSTLAGEFAFSISLSLSLLFLGTVARGLDKGTCRALAPVLLALTGLCHVVPAFFAIVGAVVLLLVRVGPGFVMRLRWWITTMSVGGGVAAFWVLPFLARLPYTNDMGWEKITLYSDNLFPERLRWLIVLAAAGAILSTLLLWRSGMFLTITTVIAGLAFVLAPQSRLWNARLIPFWFLCLYLLAGVAFAAIAHLIGVAISGREDADLSIPALVAPMAVAIAAIIFVGMPLQVLPSWLPWTTTADSSFIPSWVAWNYSGYERKASYPEYRDVVNTMAGIGNTNGCGRAMWEYEPELDRMGTPMALMLLPYWTDGCIGSMEGLFFESSASTPYHFLNQSELSLVPSRAQRDLPYRDLDVASGVAHMQLIGVRYYMAISPNAQEQARANPDLSLVATSGPWTVNYKTGPQQRTWEVYEVARSDQVAALTEEPVVMTGVAKGGREWLDAAVSYYQDAARWDVPLAASGPKQWQRIDGPTASPPRKSVAPVAVTNIATDDDSISFDVDRVGVPVLVKMSYFPNWQVSGADGPYRVTPNQMVVIPTSKHVSLEYKSTPVDWFSWLITLVGLATVVVLARRPDLVYPEPPPPPPAPLDTADGEGMDLEFEEASAAP